MAGAKEIRTKISSIKNTQKITKAMEMVAASKMRKAQERMRAARPYAEKLRSVIGHLRLANPDYKHSFLVDRPVKATGIIVIATDRGLAGGLNINLFKAALTAIKAAQAKGEKIQLCLIGTKAVQFFRRLSLPIAASATTLGDRTEIAQLIDFRVAVEIQHHLGGADQIRRLGPVAEMRGRCGDLDSGQTAEELQGLGADDAQVHFDILRLGFADRAERRLEQVQIQRTA